MQEYFIEEKRTEQARPLKFAKANRGLAIGRQVPAGQSTGDGIRSDKIGIFNKRC